MASITINGLSKRFGATNALKNVDLSVADGELFFLLGPSGCGKTTLLRLVAGFDFPDEGSIFFDDRDVTFLPCEKRGVAVVFQQYALWPHMSVAENLRFGLEAQKLPREIQRKRVREALDMVRLTPFADRYPHELSGGQQQRVAVARALALQPHVILLDEPLSNLDPSLRIAVREEMKELQAELAITMVYVTHDHSEALSAADRLALLKEGAVSQVGTPREIYERPNDIFIAGFLGEVNLVEGDVRGIRPERLFFSKQSNSDSTLTAVVQRILFHGSTTTVVVRSREERELSVLHLGPPLVRQGEEVTVHYALQDCFDMSR